MPVEYVEMSNPQYEYISKRVRESFPESCICWIEENINDRLLIAYEERKFEAAKKGAINEVQFFHGTSENVINSIAAGGFDPSYNKASAYGKGTYFAKNASYSFSYMKPNKVGISFMFLCNVIMGRSCIGSGNLIIDTNKFDSAVDCIKNPSIVVTPYADAAYPRYIIAFHKNAK
jgi:hypothetical protein